MANIKSSHSRLRRMEEKDLNMVRQWRNHYDIRRYMYTQHEISENEHKLWYEKCSVEQNRHLLIFEKNYKPLGFVNFHQIDNGRSVDWGFYLSPEVAKGTGKELANEALAYAFDTQNFHKVCGQAIAYNERSIHLHLRCGFTQEGILREQYFDGEHYHSVKLFGLLKSEWQKFDKSNSYD